MQSSRELLEAIYAAFNTRQIDMVLARLHPNVDWPNGMEGGRVHGRENVREYWLRQWKTLDPHVEPMNFTDGELGRTVVEVHQVVHDLDGNLLADKMVGHIFRIEKGLVKRFDIRGE